MDEFLRFLEGLVQAAWGVLAWILVPAVVLIGAFGLVAIVWATLSAVTGN